MNLNRDDLNLIRATKAGRVEQTMSDITRRRTNGIAMRVDKSMRRFAEAGLVACPGPGNPWRVTAAGDAAILGTAS